MLKLRQANENDKIFLNKVCLDTADLYDSFMPGAFERQGEKYVENGLPTNYKIKIISMDNVNIGFVGYQILESGTYYLVALYLLKKYQKQGFGRLVHEKIVDELKKTTTKRLALFVHIKAEWAIDFYKKIGYTIIANSINEISNFDHCLVDYYILNTYLMKFDL